MSPNPPRPVGNRLLDALPQGNYEPLRPHLEQVSLSVGDIVYEPREQISHAYFPVTSHVSLLYTMMDGATAGMGLVGNEGVVGIALLMGAKSAPHRAVVQGGGNAFRLKAQIIVNEFNLGGEFQSRLLRYTQALITQMSHTAVCNRLHSVEQRLCRWLLMTRDRTPSNELQMTQEFMANILGVRREGVTHAAHGLQKDGLISYARGHITILNRRQLEARVCECYAVVKEAHERLLGQVQ